MSKRNRRSGGKGKGAPPGGSRTDALAVPRWLPPALIGAATVLLFRSFIFSDRMLFGGDTVSLGLAARSFFAEALTEQGVFPRWNPRILGGTPFLEALSGGDALYPTSLLLLIMEPYRALGWKLVVHVCLAGLFMFGWVRALGRSRAAALVAGAAYTVAPFLVTFVTPGHDGKLFVTALTPLLFWAMEWTFRRRGALPYVSVAFVVALVIFTTHFQFAYFLFGAAGVYYLVRSFFVEGAAGTSATEAPLASAGRFALFLVASVAGASMAGVQLVPAVAYVTEHSRRTATTVAATDEENRAYASSWSMHPEEVVGLVVPEFPGNDSGGAAWTQGTYWGRNVTRDNHQYTGWVVLLLAALGFFGMPGRGVRRFLAGLGGVAILYALGSHTPVWGLFFDFVPGVSLFRATDNAAFLFGFAAVTLAAFGVDRALALAERAGSARARHAPGDEASDARIVTVCFAAGGALLLATLLAAAGGLTSIWTSVVYRAIDPDRVAALNAYAPFITRGFFVATLLAAGLGATLWAARRRMLRPSGVIALITALVLVDGFRVSHSFVQTVDRGLYFGRDPIVEDLAARRAAESPFRVTDFTRFSQETRLSYFGVELASGHHPNDLARYRELIGMVGSGRAVLLEAPNVSALLNVRYVVLPGRVEGIPPLAEANRLGRPQALYRAADVAVRTDPAGRMAVSSPGAPPLERARLVGRAVVVPDEEAVETILAPNFDPATTAVLSEEPPIELSGVPVTGEVTWIERGLNRQTLSVTNEEAALLVVADNWFPAWRATVDGEPVPLLRAYHSLRAVALEPGTHEVVFAYRSDTVRRSLVLSLVAFLLCAGLGVVDWTRSRRATAEVRDAAKS